MKLDMKTALQFNFFKNLIEDSDPNESLLELNKELNKKYSFTNQEIELIITGEIDKILTKGNVYMIVDFLTFVDFVDLENVVKNIVENYMFKRNLFFRELSRHKSIIEYICNTCEKYINDGILSFNTVVRLFEFFDCSGFLENDIWILKEIDTDLYHLTYHENHEGLMIPANVVEIEFGESFNHPVKLHSNVKKLKFGNDFNQAIKLPKGIESVEFGDEFNQLIDFPRGMKELVLGNGLRQKIKLPPSLRKFEINCEFPQDLDLPDLPDSIEELITNQNVFDVAILPKHLKKIKGGEFLHYFESLEGVEEIEVINHVNLSINLPTTLKKFKCGRHYNMELKFHEGVEVIELGNEFNKSIILPSTVKVFKTGDKFNQSIKIPLGIKKLKIGNDFDQPLTFPYGIEEIEIGGSFTHPINLPSTVEKFTICSDYEYNIKLPNGIKHVEFTGLFNQKIKLPPSVKIFRSGGYFDQPIVFPQGIVEIDLSVDSFYKTLSDSETMFNHPITLPSSVKIFKSSDMFNQHIVLPIGIEEVMFSHMFNRPINLPFTVKKFALYGDWRADKYIVDGANKMGSITFPEGIETIHIVDSGYEHTVVLPSTVKEYCNIFTLNNTVFNERIEKIKIYKIRGIHELPKHLRIKWIDGIP